MVLPGPTGTPVSAFDTISAGALALSAIVYAPRPWVPSSSSRRLESKSSCQVATLGIPVPRLRHELPPSVVTKVPTSVPAYSVFGYAGSSTTELVGTSGSPLLTSVQVAPPFDVLKTWPVLPGVAALNPAYDR